MTPGTEDVAGNGAGVKQSKVIAVGGRPGREVHSLIRSDGDEADRLCTPGTENVVGNGVRVKQSRVIAVGGRLDGKCIPSFGMVKVRRVGFAPLAPRMPSPNGVCARSGEAKEQPPVVGWQARHGESWIERLASDSGRWVSLIGRAVEVRKPVSVGAVGMGMERGGNATRPRPPWLGRVAHTGEGIGRERGERGAGCS